jgi:8-amino-7-oxononanoate synthase
VLSESIFSMDGDAADLAGLARLKESCPFVLLLDEAHASGVYGPAGAGYAAEAGLASAVDISVVTLSKALGGCGGAVCGSAEFCDALVNFGRAYVYSTSLAPSAAAAASAAVAVMREEPHQQQRLRDLARRVRAELARSGVAMPPGDSPIIPVILGAEDRAVAAADRLLGRGILVGAIRPPAVARGTSRLRITLSSAHTDEEIELLLSAVGDVLKA